MEIYLDNAATSHPKPPSVLQAVHEALTTFNGNPGRSGHARALSGSRLILSARETLSALLNAPQPECIVFCFNCTDALNTAIKGSLCVGDHVVTSTLEHNSVLRVLKTLESRSLISLTLIDPEPDGMVNPLAFQRALRPDTRLCVLTHASNVTGAIQPVAEVGRIMQGAGVRYLIDGAQAIGHLPVDVQALRCDFYAFPGHKGLLGPQGSGGLYVASGTPLRTFREGGTGSGSDSMLQPAERPECFESGTLNLPGIAGMKAGANMLLQNQRSFMNAEQDLTRALWEGLQSLENVVLYTPAEASARVGVISFNVSGKTSSEVCDHLSSLNIAVRGGLHCAPGAHQFLGTLRRGAVRASLSWQNTHKDVEALLRALHRFSA